MTNVTCIVTVVVMMMTVRSSAENRDDWIDPNDMLNFDPSSNLMRKDKIHISDLKTTTTTTPCPDIEGPKECPVCESCPPCREYEEADRTCPEPVQCPLCNCEPAKECVCNQAALPLLRQYIKTVLKHIGDQAPSVGKEDYTFHISLSPDVVTILEKFVEFGNQKHVHDVHNILTGMINRVVTSRLGRMEKVVVWLEEKIGLKLDRLQQFFMLGALASIVLLIEVKLQIAWRRRISQLIVLMFLISVPWTWFELYKHAEIKQQSMVMKTMPKECEGGEQGMWSTMKSYFTFKDDICHEYYEHLMIDPVIKVPPTKAIAVTFVRFFVAPLKDVGSAMSEFIRALLIDLPLTLYPIAIGMVGMFVFMFLFMWFGYSIRLPFLVTIERSPHLSVANSQLQQAIQDTSRQTFSQLETLQARLESTEMQISDKLQHLQKVQQAAIEYSMSSEPAFMAGSSSISRSNVTESPTIPRSEVSKKSEVKVMSAPFVSAAMPSCDSVGPLHVSDMMRGEPDPNVTNNSDYAGAKIRNDDS